MQRLFSWINIHATAAAHARRSPCVCASCPRALLPRPCLSFALPPPEPCPSRDRGEWPEPVGEESRGPVDWTRVRRMRGEGHGQIDSCAALWKRKGNRREGKRFRQEGKRRWARRAHVAGRRRTYPAMKRSGLGAGFTRFRSCGKQRLLVSCPRNISLPSPHQIMQRFYFCRCIKPI
jgi:hypothetical protein